MRVKHNLEPVYSNHSKTLILGSMPSQESRRIGKYYGHKSNRFWRILEELYDEKIEDWKDFIIRHDLALWDVIGECDIKASSDASIKNTRLNDIKSLITKTQIENIFLLGKSAYNLYYKFLYESLGIAGIYLPSPSSANASKSLNDLIRDYELIKTKTEN